MKIEYLESEGFFTSNGFFKIWNYSLRKNFPIFWPIFRANPNHGTSGVTFMKLYLVKDIQIQLKTFQELPLVE